MSKDSLEDIPVEVYVASFILSKKFVGLNELNKAKEIVLKNKNYFPTYYNFFTADKETLDKYYDELNELHGVKDWKKQAIEKSNHKGGIWSIVAENIKAEVVPEKLTKKDIKDFFDSIEATEKKRQELKRKEEKLFKKYFRTLK